MKTVFIIHEDLSAELLLNIRNKAMERWITFMFMNLKYCKRSYIVKNIEKIDADAILIYDEDSMRINDIDYLQEKLVGLDLVYFSARRIPIVFEYLDNFEIRNNKKH